MKKKILITVGYKKRELEYLCLLAAFLERAKHDVRIVFANYEVYHTIFSWRPDIILLGQVNQNENIAVAKYANKSGSVVIVLNCEGSYNKDSSVTFFGTTINDFVDYYLVWGRQQKTDVKKLTDLKSNKIMACGTPKFDVYNHYIMDNFHKELQPHPKFDKKKQTICIGCSFLVADLDWNLVKNNVAYKDLGEDQCNKEINFQKKLRKAYIKLAEAISNTGFFNVLLRVHPLENDYEYRKALSKKSNILIDNSTTPVQLFSMIDLLIHRTSTLAIEAWIAGVPTLSFDPLNNEDGWMLNFTSFEKKFNDQQKLISYLTNKSTKFESYISEKQNNFLQHWYGVDKDDRSFASDRIATFITSIKSKKKKREWNIYVSLFYLFDILKIFLKYKYNYQVIGLFKGKVYRSKIKDLYITEKEVKIKIQHYHQLLSSYFSSINK